MSRFFVERSQIGEEFIVLEGGDVNHIRNVLRMRPGEKIEICDGQGTDYDCIIDAFPERQAILRIVSQRPACVELPVRLVLYQGLPKGDKMELIVQKAVELGAAEIVPVLCRRSVVRLDDKKKEEKKRERWQTIAESAAKQSGRGRIPAVAAPLPFAEAVRRAASEGRILLPYENAEGMRPTREAFLAAGQSGTTGIFIGPEGGFDAAEVACAAEAGAKIVSLGRRILRTETAGLAVLSALMLLCECAEAEKTAEEG